MKTLKDAIEIIMAEPPEMHYPAYFANLLRQADVPDKDVGKCSESPNSSETIYRQAAIDALRDKFKRTPTNAIRAMDAVKQLPSAEPRERLIAKIDVSEEQIRDALEKMRNEPVQIMPSAEPEKRTDKCAETHACDLPSAEPEQQNARIFQGIIVEYPSISTYPEYKGKPYFSIKYTENGQEFIGYGTYKPEVLSEYLKEYFMSSAQTDLIAEIQNGIKATNMDDRYFCGMRNGMRWCISLIDGKNPLYENCPPAQHERKKGHWIVDALANNIYHCSECGADAPVEPTGGTEYKSNYCLHCGADMRGEENETD